MTIPYFENCPHSDEGWCLDCISEFGRKLIDKEDGQDKIDKIEDPPLIESTKSKACEGGPTITDGDFEECPHCGTRVRHDLVDNPFFGFRVSCPHKCGANKNDKES